MVGMSLDRLSTMTDLDLEGLHFELAGKGRDIQGFKSRLRFLGMTDHAKVLDFGCGFGQWSLALADLNAVVFGIDKAPQRLDIARRLSDLVRTSGTVTFGESPEDLSLGADHFSGQLDAILLQRFHVFAR